MPDLIDAGSYRQLQTFGWVGGACAKAKLSQLFCEIQRGLVRTLTMSP